MMNEEFTLTEYTVDLSREEYVRSQELLAKHTGRVAAGSRWFSVVMLGFCVMTTLFGFAQFGAVDFSLISLLVLLVGSELWMMLSLPKQLRRRSEAAYDATVYGGYSFTGTIRVEADALRKITKTATTVLPFAQCRLFVESADMLIFCGMDGKSIVVPARFLTEETAHITRQAALAAIPVTRQVLLEMLQPCAVPEAAAVSAESEDAVLTVEIDYTDAEMVNIATESALGQFWETLPQKSVFATMAVFLCFFMWSVKPLPLFLLILLVLFLYAVIKTRVKMRRAITRSERGICRLRAEFSETQVWLYSKADGMRPMRLPWSHITRAVNCRDTVELYTGKERQLSIPKRCIADFEEFCKFVDSRMAVT